jgi:DNA polymerase (family 10)
MRPGNDEIADQLEQIGALLGAQGADSYRVRAYGLAARSLRALDRPVAEIDAEAGSRGLEALPHIGRSIAALIHEELHTGRIGLLERLEGEVSPEDLFVTVPGIGETLAARLHGELGLETLEDLELAAHDGRLESLSGFGPRRARGIRETLASRLSRSTRRRARRVQRARGAESAAAQRPSVATLLALDATYRRRAEEGSLGRIAPRRFNPEGRAWLPVLHEDRDGWSFHALFSNTARAHELGRTRDWVILYWERDGHEDQCTIVTELRGPLAGRRVVRGREAECAEHYETSATVRSS